ATDQTFTITVHVGADYSGATLANTAAFGTRATTDPADNNDSSTATVDVGTSADLAVTKAAATDPVTAGTDETYTITVHNNGPSDAGAYTVTDAVPFGTTFVSASTGCALASGTVTCSSTGLAFGATDQTFTITVHVGAN